MIFRILILTVLFASCENNSKKNITIDLNHAITINEKNIYNYHSIPLETANDCKLINPTKMTVSDSVIFIFDQSLEQIFLFRKNTGAFIQKLISDSLLKVIDYCFDEKEKKITAILAKGKKLHLKTFNDTGTFLKDLHINDEASNLLGPSIINYNNYYCFDRGSLFMDGNHLSFIDSKSMVHRKSIIPMNAALKGAGWIVSNNAITTFNDSLFYFPILSDTIYSIDRKLTVFPYYIFKIRNKHRITPKSLLNEYSTDFSSLPTLTTTLDKKGYIWEHSHLIQNNDFLYFSMRDGAILCGIFFNKTNRESYLINGSNLSRTSNVKFALPITTYKNQFAALVYPSSVQNAYKRMVKMNKNPTVVMYSLKFHNQ